MRKTQIKYKYLQVADAIAARIESGYYSCKLRGERDLAEEFGVSYATVRRAMRTLRERGLIVSIYGSGTFIKGMIHDGDQHRGDDIDGSVTGDISALNVRLPRRNRPP